LSWQTSGRGRSHSTGLLPDSWLNWSRIIVVSPHSDDAALSLPAVLTHLHRKGMESTIVTCFSVSAFAPYADMHTVSYVTELRKAEDVRYASTLGLSCRVVWLGCKDAPLRGVHEIFRERDLTREDRACAVRMSPRIESMLSSSCAIFLPLGLGAHVDHIIACEAGLSLAAAGSHDMLFYEDMPYLIGLDERKLRQRATKLARILRGQMSAIRCSGAAVLGLKAEAASCYPSQFHRQQILEYLSPETRCRRCRSERIWQLIR
jgi:LmbE family N-acetylglucosaminyl deacetylase